MDISKPRITNALMEVIDDLVHSSVSYHAYLPDVDLTVVTSDRFDYLGRITAYRGKKVIEEKSINGEYIKKQTESRLCRIWGVKTDLSNLDIYDHLKGSSKFINYYNLLKGSNSKFIKNRDYTVYHLNYTYRNSGNCGAIFITNPTSYSSKHGSFVRVIDVAMKLGATKKLCFCSDRVNGFFDSTLNETTCKGFFKVFKSDPVRNVNSGNDILSITLTSI